jgi:hypothetical protein
VKGGDGILVVVYLGEVVDVFKVVGCDTLGRLGLVKGFVFFILLIFSGWIWLWSLV